MPTFLTAGHPSKSYQNDLGTPTQTFTIDTYQHVLPGMQAESALVFEDVLATRN